MTFSEYARRYSELDWALVRLEGKIPVTKNWQTTAPGEPENMAGRWAEWGKRYGMGVVLRPSRLVVFEYDDDDARERYLELLGGELPATPIARTGRGLLHTYFTDPGGLQKAARDGLELRVGEHQCVVPPSIHPDTGEPYEWLEGHEPWVVECLPVPSAVREYFNRNGRPKVIPEKLTPSTRHESFVTLAAELRKVGVGEAAILASLRGLNAEQGDPPKDDAELVAIARDAMGWRVSGQRVPANVEEIAVEREQSGPAPTLAHVLRAVRLYLDVTPSEQDFIIGALATAVSKVLVDEEPLWLILIGASGGGKTEAIKLLASFAEGRVDELTRAGLLSWAPGKKAKSVGLLTRIPSSSLVTISDFSTVVTMGDREARARMFGMLRVVYDGRVYRSIGGQPAADGDELVWEGHLTLIAAGTPVVDTHTSFEGALGERWLMLRLAESDPTRARDRARFAIRRENAAERREEAQAAARRLVLAARERIPARLDKAAENRLVDVATFVALARCSVTYEGQGKYRVITSIPTPEEPTRLAGQLTRLARCAVALGLDEDEALRLAITAAVDSVPLARLRALRRISVGGGATVEDVRRALGRANWYVAKWELDALETIGLAQAETVETNGFEQTYYSLHDAYRPLYTNVGFSRTSPPNKGVGDGGAPYDSVEGQTRMASEESDDGIPF